jgi:BASS family bile acid:Na+ symporter
MKLVGDVMIVIFVVSCVLSVCLKLSVAEIVAPMRQPRLVLFSLLANFVVVPFAAVLISRAMSLAEPLAIGLVLMGAAAGAPFLPKLVEVGKGDAGLAVALMVLLMVASLGYLPLLLPHLLAGVSVNSLQIAQSLLFTMVLPLGIGLWVKARNETLARRLRPPLNFLSNISLIAVLVIIPAMHWERLQAMLRTTALPASVALIGVSFAAGYLLGGPTGGSREVVGFSTGARNIPAALLIATQNFADANVAVMVIIIGLASLLMLAPLALFFARSKQAQSTQNSGGGMGQSA